jgi:hypothetical protein
MLVPVSVVRPETCHPSGVQERKRMFFMVFYKYTTPPGFKNMTELIIETPKVLCGTQGC